MAIHTSETTSSSHTSSAGQSTMLRPRTTNKGWHDDPRGEHKLRFHDGEVWTEHTTHFGPVPCQGCAR